MFASRLLAISVAIVLFGSATVAIAATDSGRYRTNAQAAHYLTHRLRSWADLDLSKFPTKTAFCVGANRSSHGRVNRDGVPVYRSFSCVLDVTVASGKHGTRVFQLDLEKEQHGWQVRSD